MILIRYSWISTLMVGIVVLGASTNKLHAQVRVNPHVGNSPPASTRIGAASAAYNQASFLGTRDYMGWNRGGYGSGQLLPEIDPDVIRQNAKIVCGSSDITMLLNWMDRAGVVSFHGPMVATSIRRGTEGYDRELLLNLLQGATAVRFPTKGTAVLRAGRRRCAPPGKGHDCAFRSDACGRHACRAARAGRHHHRRRF